MSNRNINIIGAGLSGLSAAIRLARKGLPCRLISVQPSERAQSVMAEGGINAALDTMGENDEPLNHYNDTLKGGVYLADENAVRNLTFHAPETVEWLYSLGVPFNMKGGQLVLRNFGGQKKKRTAYSRSSTGKILMSALIDEARKYEERGMIRRYPHHRFEELVIEEGRCAGVKVTDLYTGSTGILYGAVLLCSGGLNSLFPELTTGTAVNTGDVTATVFSQGVELANLEFIQYHPTTAAIPGKRCLISEAARGEGGRLFIYKDDKPYYFMEELYPELGNLMPRDVVSREMAKTGQQVYLDMTHLSEENWERVSDLREECIRLLGTDPKTDYVKVAPGIHFFMGGIYVDEHHRTSLNGLWASGECACQYHGANRLGGNSMLGAVYGGLTAAEDAAGYAKELPYRPSEWTEGHGSRLLYDYGVEEDIASILRESLGIFREEESLKKALEDLVKLEDESMETTRRRRYLLAKAALMCALNRRESRGAHTRLDYPERDDDNYGKTSVVRCNGFDVDLTLREIPRRAAE